MDPDYLFKLVQNICYGFFVIKIALWCYGDNTGPRWVPATIQFSQQ